MTLPKPTPEAKRVVKWLGGIISLLFVLTCLLPAELPQHYTYIDDSWMQVLHLAFLRHLQFGTDIVYTLGPWGFLYGGYRPETHVISVVVWLALAIIFWWAAWRAAQLSFKNELAAWVWVMVITSVTGVAVVVNIEARLLCWPLLLLLLHFFGEDRALTVTKGLLIFSMGLIGLLKFSALIQCGVIVLAVGADTIWRRKQFPWAVILFGGSIFFFWLLAGQRLSSFVPFIRNSLEITSGYSNTMMETGPREMKYVGGFIVIALALLALAAFAMWKRLRFFGVLPLGALGFIIFSLFKYGFVRDDAHQAIGALLLLLVSLICLAIVSPVVCARKYFLPATAGGAIVAAFLFAVFSFERWQQIPLTRQLAGTFAPRKWLGPAQLIYQDALYRKTWEEYLAGYRNQFPLPALKGDIDYYSWNQMDLFAHGLQYRPRPVFQSFSAYTPRLAELNAAYLRSDQAAPTIVFDAGIIDNRYTSLEDGLSWPELLTRYDVQEVEFPFVVLTRSENPRQFKLIPLGETSIKFGEQLTLPIGSNNIVWAEIQIDRTLAGGLISTLFKPPELFLKTTLGHGKTRTHRIIPEMARTGFLLSPFIKDCTSFATLTSSNWPGELMEDALTAFSIVTTNGAMPPGAYQNSIRVRLYQLDFPRRNLDNVAGFSQVVELKEEIRRIKFLQHIKLKYVPGVGSVLGGSPDSAILLEQPPEAQRIHLGFGISDEPQSTNGITFRASGINERREGTLLWSRRLDPASTPDDRGKQEMTIDLANRAIAAVLLETIPDNANSTSTNSPYWFEMHFEQSKN
jgi:hypothetical protein